MAGEKMTRVWARAQKVCPPVKDRGPWYAAVLGVANSQAGLGD